MRRLFLLTATFCALLIGGCQDGASQDGGNDRSDLSSTGGQTFIDGNTGGNSMGSGGAASGGTFTSSGSTSSTGGATATGTPTTEYDFGYVPSTIFVEDAQAAYEDWKDVHLEDCGGGRYRVRWENEKLDATVSEGIGYGMLLAVVWGERDVFDGLYDYYQAASNETTGLMHWLRYGCGADWSLEYSAYPDGAAADADLDVAMALIMAHCKWNDASYSSEASSVIGAIRSHMFMTYEGMNVLQPGDSEWFDDLENGCVNYSYFSPAYYREFAAYDAANASFWNAAADDSYDLLNLASHGSTGLVRNWGSSDGSNAALDCHNAYNRAASYGDDAARTPWRVATDYLWNGTAEAKTWADKVTTWVKTVGIENTIQWYHLDGAPDTMASTYDDHTAINVGPWATGAMTFDQATVDEFAAELATIPAGPTDHDGEYFPRMLSALTLATLAGKFTTCGGQ
jgi:endo-1,4-beta-D-glucanase Y